MNISFKYILIISFIVGILIGVFTNESEAYSIKYHKTHYFNSTGISPKKSIKFNPSEHTTSISWPTYDNVGPNAIADCAFAAAADWIIYTQHTIPPEDEVINDFYAAGGSSTEGTNELNNWWKVHNIDGYSESLSLAHGNVARGAIEEQTIPTITEFEFFNGNTHMVLTLGPASNGVEIITWGNKYTITWFEWEILARINFQVNHS